MSLRNNTYWNLAGTGLPLLLGAVSIPYLLRHIGIEPFGILTLIWALIGYFSLFDFGLGRALTQQVSASRAAAREDYLPALVKSGLIITAGTGLIGGFLLAVLAYPLAFGWLGVSGSLRQSAADALLIASLGVPMTTLTTGLRGVLEAYEDFPAVNLLRLFLGIANFGLPMFSVMVFGKSLPMMVACLIAARLAILIVHFLLVNRKFSRGWRGEKISRWHLRQLFSFGAWMTLSNIVGPLMVMADRFIISGFLGAAVVAYYSVPSEMLMRVLIIPGAATAALFPRFASALVKDLSKAHILYKRSMKVVSLLMTPICLSIAAGAHWGLSMWLGSEFAANAWMLTVILTFGIFFNGMAQIPHSVLQAAGQVRLTALLHLTEFILYMPLLLIALSEFGLIGAAVIWVLRVAIDFLVLLMFSRKVFSSSLQ